MVKGGGLEAEGFMQPDLAGGRADQVAAAYDLVHALERVVHDHRELIAEHAVRPADDVVAALGGGIIT